MCNPFEEIDARLSNIEKMLHELSRLGLLQAGGKKHDAESQTLTVKDAAKLLNVSHSTIYSYVNNQEIPVCKRGRRLYFSEEDLLAWVRAGRKQTVDEIQKSAMQGAINHYSGRRNKHN